MSRYIHFKSPLKYNYTVLNLICRFIIYWTINKNKEEFATLNFPK